MSLRLRGRGLDLRFGFRDAMYRTMLHRHVQTDRRVRIGLARLQKRMDDAAIFPAGIEQHIRTGGRRVHGHVFAWIHLCMGGRAGGQSGEQGQGRNSQFHQAVRSLFAATIDAVFAPLNIA